MYSFKMNLILFQVIASVKFYIQMVPNRAKHHVLSLTFFICFGTTKNAMEI